MVEVIKKWIFNDENVKNRVINGLGFSEIDEFHLDVERENQPSTYSKKPISIKIVGKSGKAYTVTDIMTCEHRTLIRALYDDHDVNFIFPTKDIFSQLTDD